MRLFFRYTDILIIFLFINFHAEANGLKFNGSEHLIDERTSYNVFCEKSPLFTNKLDISFDISLLESSHYGYIVRIKNNEANKTFNLSYYVEGASTVFKFNEEGGKNLITASVNHDELQKINWFRISIIFDLKNHILLLNINNQLFKENNVVLPPEWKPEICFGRSDYLIDVPSFAIRNLSVSDKKHKYIFPLQESKGNIAHDVKGREFGCITNPVWLIKDAYYWSYRQTFKSASVAGCNFDEKTDNLYIFNKDSLITYNVRTGASTMEKFPEKCPVDIFLGTNFLDKEEKKLYVYDVYNENNKLGPNVAVLDLKTKRWKALSNVSLYMQLHHHSAAFDEQNKKFYIFGGFGGVGGFGNMQYSKSLYSFNFNTNKWDSLKLSGDKVNPRYFSAMCYKKEDNSLYIFGGMGNESGEQVVGRRYYYDFYKVSLNDNKVVKLWEISWNKENVVPVRQMIFQDDSCFYTLCYPEHFSKTHLKLYRFSLKDGSFKILGDSVPIRSEKIKTEANLYYSHSLNNLFAVIQEFDNQDISSVIKIYSLAFPPISYEELVMHEPKSNRNSVIIISFIFLLLMVSAFVLFRKLRNKRKRENLELEIIFSDDNGKENSQDKSPIRSDLKPNGIYLFGEFRVQDRKNRDITYMFSSKLKQAFLIILQHSYSGGISSQRLSELLWPDKPEDKVKNSRGVTINHLRKIIKELDGIELVYEKGLFRIEISQEFCYCDYLRCMELIDSNMVEENIMEFLNIIRQGKFLRSIDLPEFDPFKEDVEKKLEPVLLIEIEKNFNNGANSTTVVLCEALFNIDPINDDAIFYLIHALIKLRMNDEAKKRYFLFVSEYKKMMGKEYPVSYSELLSGKRRIRKI